MSKRIIRCFTSALTDILNPDDMMELTQYYQTLDAYYNTLTHDDKFTSLAFKNADKYGNDYTRTMNTEYGKPYQNWNITNPAKYYRIILAFIHDQITSMRKREQTTISAAKYLFNKNKYTEIREYCHDTYGFLPTNADLQLVCNAHGNITRSFAPHMKLDYRREDNQICKQTNLEYSIKCTHWLHFTIKRPPYLRNTITKYCKPLIEYRNGEFLITIAYEIKPPVISTKGNILGVDIGKILPFVACAYNPITNECSQALHPSDELTRIKNNINNLTTRITQVQAKNMRMIRTLRDQSPDNHTSYDTIIINKITGRHHHIKSMRNHKALLKKAYARLWARDVINHAIEQHCGTIHIENLKRLRTLMQSDSFGSWNYSECFTQLTSLATSHGIRIIRINPSQTSHTDPYTNQPVTPSPNRTIRTINGTLDRDYIASMNIARTIKHVRSSPLVKPNKTKHRVTPRKPHSYTRKHISKLIKQIINNVNAGRTPVSATSCATRNALLTHGKHPLTHATQQSPFIIPHSIMNGNNTGYGIDKTILASGPFDDGMKSRNSGFLHG